MALTFALWLQQELENREWNQSELARAAKQRGYSIGTAQISRILNEEQEAGVSSVIAIAYGLGISRDAAFRARGWLLSPPLSPLQVTNESIQQVALALMDLDPEKLPEICHAILALLNAKVP